MRVKPLVLTKFLKSNSAKLFLLFLLLSFMACFSLLSAQGQGTIPPSQSSVYLPLVAVFITTDTPTSIYTPTPTATSTPMPPTVTPTLVPGVVSIKSNHPVLVDGALHVFGEMFNDRDVAVYNILIKVVFYDKNHKSRATGINDTYLAMVSPRQAVPFHVIGPDNDDPVDSYVISAKYQTESPLEYRPITVLSQQERNTGGVEIFGKLRNEAGRALVEPRVVVTFYDTDGQVVDIGYTWFDRLDKGRTIDYSVKTNKQINYTSYLVQSEGHFAP